ncbi:MAG TPA: hypothetical protein VL598_15150 [Trinickia sp.]|uniref:hypothetical protein n=1 Tax=Trinickia sp. TaxID=2571163 RepID=UPI002C022CCF|nr:hypothetical protein [Trinickia sp.]HTI18995.1 hypothetical protein [Trinickia sp.]
MRELPILFSGAMVRAILDGHKTQTRRPIKGFALDLLQPGNFTAEFVALPENGNSPYGYAGDHLWVKETFVAFGRWETRYSDKKKRNEWRFVDLTLEAGFSYRFDGADPDARRCAGAAPTWRRRPSIFMPCAASRITLEVTGVRVERLQDITEADAIAEGVTIEDRHKIGYCSGATRPPSIRAYAELWDSLNAARGYPWDVNPWVWVIEFKRI